MIYFNMTVANIKSTINIQMAVSNTSVEHAIFIRRDEQPTITNFDRAYLLRQYRYTLRESLEHEMIFHVKSNKGDLLPE